MKIEELIYRIRKVGRKRVAKELGIPYSTLGARINEFIGWTNAQKVETLRAVEKLEGKRV